MTIELQAELVQAMPCAPLFCVTIRHRRVGLPKADFGLQIAIFITRCSNSIGSAAHVPYMHVHFRRWSMNVAMTRRFPIALAVLTAGSLLAAAPLALARDDDDKDRDARRFSTELSGFNEVHFVAGNGTPQGLPALRGAIFSDAKGKFRAFIDKGNDRILYELEYSGLGSDVTQAHIHFGQKHTVGGIVVWLCQTTGTPAPTSVAALTPVCPQDTSQSGPVRGIITAAQVLAQTAQGINAGDFDAVVRAIRNNAAYANVHTQTFTPGEIRGHIEEHERHSHGDRR